MARRFLILAAALFLLLAFASGLASAAGEGGGGETPCLPAASSSPSQNCLMLGPAQFLSSTAQQGISLPMQPLPAARPDPSLSDLPYTYARVNRPNTPMFTSLSDAANGEPVYKVLQTGFDFITYVESAVVDGDRYYMITPGIWMPAGGMSPVRPSEFQGLRFFSTPENDFGWVLYPTQAKRTPGTKAEDYTNHYFTQYDVVQVYGTQDVGGVEWVLVGPDEWLDGRRVAQVSPNPVSPEGVDNGRWVEVNLAEQIVAVYSDQKLVFATVISSGLPGSWTRPGLFRITEKKETEVMSGAFTADRSDYYYLEDVPWTMYFDQARALHGTYWHNGFGVPRSRGCVNLSPGDARWLFDWAQEGDWVYVWDPSGRTPEDPSLYSAGGA